MSSLTNTANAGLARKTAAAVFLSCITLLSLSGCRIPGLQCAEPAAPLPACFVEGELPGSSANLEVHQFFTDPKLTVLIDDALAGNQQLKILNQDIVIANNEILRRRGAILPFFSLGANARVNKWSYNTIEGSDNLQGVPISAPHFPKPLPDFLVAGNVSWQIDIWRQLRNARDAAQLRFLGSIDGRTYTVTRLIADVAENYYTLMALDKRMQNLNRIIALQQQSLETAAARKEFARDTELAVQRFRAEVRKNESERLILKQEIIETENRINFLSGRFPQPVDRSSDEFFDVSLPQLMAGIPAELLQLRPDIRQAERELEAAGLDIAVARANFYPKLIMSSGVGWEAFNTRYLFLTPESLIYNAAGNLTAPLINRSAIVADYSNANARQLQAIYEYQRTVLNAFTEVVNRMSQVQNYSDSINIKRQQLDSLESAVSVASDLFKAARPGVDYMDVLLAQRDLVDARRVMIDTKRDQLTGMVNAYQALGGGAVIMATYNGDYAAFGPDWFHNGRHPSMTPAEELPPPLEARPDPAPESE